MRMRRERKRSREGNGRNKREKRAEGKSSQARSLATVGGETPFGLGGFFAAGHGYLRHQGTNVFLPEASYP